MRLSQNEDRRDKMNKLEYLAGLNGFELPDMKDYQCKHKSYCPAHKYHMKCDYSDTRNKCMIKKFYEKYGSNYINTKPRSDSSNVFFTPNTSFFHA